VGHRGRAEHLQRGPVVERAGAGDGLDRRVDVVGGRRRRPRSSI
jgi:hypothetical protein